MPPDEEDWLCPECRDSSLYVVAEIRGKKQSHRGTSRVHYLCHWQGYGTDVDSYEPLDNIPQQARGMVRDFNKQQRERENGAGASGAKSSKRSAK